MNDDEKQKARTLPCVAIRDLASPAPDEIEGYLRQMALSVRLHLEAAGNASTIKRLIVICDDHVAGDSLLEWAVSLEPGWEPNAIPKFNN